MMDHSDIESEGICCGHRHILHLPLVLVTKPSLLFKSCHIIVYGNKIVRTTLEVQILLRHLSDVLCLIKNE